MQLVPIGSPANSYVGGAGLAGGYLNRPELTDERFIPNPFSESQERESLQDRRSCSRLSNGDLEYLRPH